MQVCTLEDLQIANDKAVSRLSSRGIIDPRLNKMQISVEGYDAIREYDSILASETLKVMRETAPPKPVEAPKQTWAERAYA